MFGLRTRSAGRRIGMVALATMALAMLVAACSSGSGLTGKTWQLTAITEKVPAFQGVVAPADQGKYTIEFLTDGNFNAKADCNNVSGTYKTSGNGLQITLGPSTLVACPEGSYSDQYIAGLAAANTYAVNGDQLTITLKDEGTLTFTAAK